MAPPPYEIITPRSSREGYRMWPSNLISQSFQHCLSLQHTVAHQCFHSISPLLKHQFSTHHQDGQRRPKCRSTLRPLVLHILPCLPHRIRATSIIRKPTPPLIFAKVPNRDDASNVWLRLSLCRPVPFDDVVHGLPLLVFYRVYILLTYYTSAT